MIFALAAVAMAADPFIGNWKLNAGKTKSAPGMEINNYVINWEKFGNGFKNVMDMVAATGGTFHVEFAAPEEGTDYPITGNPIANTISFSRIDTNTISAALKRAGSVSAKLRSSVSTDGKTLIIIQTIVNATGGEIASTFVFDKQ